MNEKPQRKRFEETARQLECDENEEKFNANLKKLASAPPPATIKERKKPKTKKPAK